MTANTVTVAIADKFMVAFSQLPKAQQKKTLEFVSKFRQDPRSNAINYEKIHDAIDPAYRSVRVDQTYRGIVRAPDEGNVFLLLWVDKHDDAYDWARRHRCEVHPNTGTLQIYESAVTSAPEQVEADTYQSPVVEAEATAVADTGPLFSLSEEQLSRLGVPVAMVTQVMKLRSETELEALEQRLPTEAFEPLYLLAAGTPWEDIEDDYLSGSAEVDTSDISAALDRPTTQQQFWVVEDEMELLNMLNAPLERWRVYLHPSQRKLVERHWNGPVRVLGGAGTGKTVVAMHRARWLVRNLLKDNERVLFTTFTVNLATDIEESLRKICSFDDMKKIQVRHIDGWVSEFLRREKYPHTIVYEDSSPEYKKIWSHALTLTPPIGLPDSFYQEEWERVILPQQVNSRTEYFKASRTGRGVALNRKQRDQIWPVFEELRSQMHHSGLKTFEDATLDAIELIHAGRGNFNYRAIVVDEAQDMGPQALTLIRALAPEQADDLFIVGDGHQRIYRRKTAFSQCGIGIVGRSRKLRINYRTTEETRRFSCALLGDSVVDDLDGGVDTDNDYRSLTHGQRPLIEGFASVSEECKWIADQIHNLVNSGVSLCDICVVARTRKLRDSIASQLESEKIATHRLNQAGDNRNVDGVRLATMHRVKGLEFHYVFLAGMNQNTVPLRLATTNTEDPVERRQNELNERALVHVAASRAVKGLYVSYAGGPSPFLDHTQLLR
ncbi:MAG: DNA helicase [Thalassolituus sp.]|nr:MAG: DNA helicase [Thalassolituus sp.]